MAFLYKGISSENYFIVEKVTRSLLPPISHTMISVPNRPGARHQNSELGIRKVDFVIRIRKASLEDLNETIRVVSEWLFSEQPEELVLTKDPEKYYMAVLDGETDLEEMIKVGKGTLTFVCPDPIAFDRVSTLFPVSSGLEGIDVPITGSYKTFPVIRATFIKDSTLFAYGAEGEYDNVLIGKPMDVEETSKPLHELALSNTGTTLTGWSAAGTSVEGGIVAGTMSTSSNAPGYMTFTGIGTNADGWHGPAVKTTLPEPLDDWKIEWNIKLNTVEKNEVGRIELYLMDVNSKIIGKISLQDGFTAIRDTFATFRVGRLAENDRHLMYYGHGDKTGVWNDFKGILRLEKRNKSYTAYIAKVDSNGRHHARKTVYFYDSLNKFPEKLAQVQMHIGGFKSWKMPVNTNIYMDSIQVYKKNLFSEKEVPLVIKAGDVIEVDHGTKAVTLNGEPFKSELNPISNLFGLKPGPNYMSFSPNDAANVEIIYRSRWL